MAADGSASRVVVAAPFEGYRKLRSPTFSPDGTRIAFCGLSPRNPDLPFVHILVVDVDGTGLASISNWRHPTCFLSWSPDGTKIAAGTYGGRGAAIVSIDADGGGRQLIVGGGDNFTPEWSPDGTHLVFLRYDDSNVFAPSDVFTVLANGRSLTNVTNSPNRYELLPTYSPDGTSIAFSRLMGNGPEAEWDLWTAQIDGSSPFRLTTTAKSEEAVDWQPVGT
jgi:TolB protein